MSFGKMNTFVDIVTVTKKKDSEGFAVDAEEILASVRAYREGRHGSEKWANRAAFTDATTLFRFRSIPGITITTAMVISIAFRFSFRVSTGVICISMEIGCSFRFFAKYIESYYYSTEGREMQLFMRENYVKVFPENTGSAGNLSASCNSCRSVV